MKSRSMETHKKSAPKSVKTGVITSATQNIRISESKDTDVSGKLIKDALNEKHEVLSYSVIPDDSKLLLSQIRNMIDKNVDVILTTGGTGIGSRDITIETLNPFSIRNWMVLEKYSDMNLIKSLEQVQYLVEQLLGWLNPQ